MKFRSTSAVAVLALLFVQQAAAEEHGVYVGGSYGGVDYGQSVGAFDDPADSSGPGSIIGGTVDNNDDGWKLVAGYRFSRYFAVEGGWTDLGEVKFKGKTTGQGGFYECPTGPDVPCDVSVTSETDGFFLVGLGVFPVGHFGFLGRVGLYDRKSDFVVEDGGPVPFKGNTDSTVTLYGLGVEYRFDRGPTVRIEWTTYTDIVTIFNNADVEFFSAGLVYRINRK